MRMCRNNALIFNFSSFSGSKVNLVGALGGFSWGAFFLKFSIVFKSTRKKKEIKEKLEFLRKTSF
ncbi:Uncharacterized protein FWK35_00021999 [Aphis craccivora]|uniref:Uncharacterized protein n=1 Tax=Aphis craccivora TaxID=307492 RepID=A0A6G0YC33_APHCR|nr:Uncharacterized protein FWK35_00021999 [Aphis craccivora]